MAFHDTVRANDATVHAKPFLRDLVPDVVLAVKGDLKVDRTRPHRENVQSTVRSAVKPMLRKRGV